MRVFVIGGTGFIGPHVVRALAARGAAVAVFHRGTTRGTLPESVTSISGDRDDAAALAEAVAAYAPAVVLDVIPYTERQARALVAACGGRRLVVLSSGDVYRNYDGLRRHAAPPPDPPPLPETAPLRTSRYPYRGVPGLDFAYQEEYEKILVEEAVREHAGATVLRLPAVYGPGDRQYRFFPFFKRFLDGRPAVLLGAQQARWRWTHGYVENIAAAIAGAVVEERAAGQTFNLGEATTPTIAARVQHLAAAAGWPGEIRIVPEGHLPRSLQSPFDTRYHLALDTRRIRTTLDFVAPVDYPTALRRTVAWQRDHPPKSHDATAFDYAAEDTVLARSDL